MIYIKKERQAGAWRLEQSSDLKIFYFQPLTRILPSFSSQKGSLLVLNSGKVKDFLRLMKGGSICERRSTVVEYMTPSWMMTYSKSKNQFLPMVSERQRRAVLRNTTLSIGLLATKSLKASVSNAINAILPWCTCFATYRALMSWGTSKVPTIFGSSCFSACCAEAEKATKREAMQAMRTLVMRISRGM